MKIRRFIALGVTTAVVGAVVIPPAGREVRLFARNTVKMGVRRALDARDAAIAKVESTGFGRWWNGLVEEVETERGQDRDKQLERMWEEPDPVHPID